MGNYALPSISGCRTCHLLSRVGRKFWKTSRENSLRFWTTRLAWLLNSTWLLWHILPISFPKEFSMLSFLLGITIGCTRQVSLFAAEVSMSILLSLHNVFFWGDNLADADDKEAAVRTLSAPPMLNKTKWKHKGHSQPRICFVGHFTLGGPSPWRQWCDESSCAHSGTCFCGGRMRLIYSLCWPQ